MRDETVLLQFIYLPIFERTSVISIEEMWPTEQELMRDPAAGALLRGTGGFRKIRVATKGRGKSGSARMVYYYVTKTQRIYVVLAFAKANQANLTGKQKNALRQIAKGIDQEE